MTRHGQTARAQRTLSNCLHSRFLNSEPFFLRLIKMKLEFALYISSCRSFSAFNEMLKRLEDFQVLFNQSSNAVGLNSQFKYKRTPHKFIAPVFSLRRPIEIPFYWSNSLCQSTLIHTHSQRARILKHLISYIWKACEEPEEERMQWRCWNDEEEREKHYTNAKLFLLQNEWLCCSGDGMKCCFSLHFLTYFVRIHRFRSAFQVSPSISKRYLSMINSWANRW